MNVEEIFGTAVERHRAGQFAEAEKLYRQVLGVAPDHADALYHLGLLAAGAGKHSAARDLILRAIALNPAVPHYHLNLGVVFESMGQMAEAMAAYRNAIAERADFPDGWFSLGNAHQSAGNTDEAIRCFHRALALRSDWPEVYNNLGLALRAAGQRSEAIAAFLRSVALKPDQPEVLLNLGDAHYSAGDLDLAIECFAQAVKLRGGFAGALAALGNAYRMRGEVAKSVECYDAAIARAPHNAEISSARLFALLLRPDYDGPALLREHRLWDEQYGKPHQRDIQWHENDPSAERRLRIGLVSADFRNHVVGLNILPLLREHDRTQFEIICYANVASPDAMTELLKSHVEGWRNIWNLDDAGCAQLIQDDCVDVLVDLSLHSAGNRLGVFARKPAPVQVTFAGYPGGTGLAAMDWRITDPFLDPPGQTDGDYVERSYRLAESFWCYDPAAMEWNVGASQVAELPALRNGHVTFGCLNNFCKVNDDVLELWGRVLGKVASSRLLAMVPTGSARQRVLEKLAGHGVTNDRVGFVTYQARRPYLAEFHRIDLGLDTFPYNGHTASLDSLWMGVPVVTRVGCTVVGRAGVSQLSNLGLTDFIAGDDERFVGIASEWAGDLHRLAGVRRSLRGRMLDSPLTDAGRFTRNIQSAWREMWKHWCEQRRAAAPISTQQLLERAARHQTHGRLDHAESLYRRVLEGNPRHAQALNNLGVALMAGGRGEEAAECFGKVVELQPVMAQGHVNLGGVLAELGKLDSAIASFRRAVALAPNMAEAHHNLGKALHGREEMGEAIAHLERAIALQPNYADALNNLGNAYKETRRIERALECYQRAVEVDPRHVGADSNRLYALHFDPRCDAQTLAREHRAWNHRHAEPLGRLFLPHGNERSPDRRLKIGYVSPDFREHVVGWNLLPLLREHDHERFEVLCYADVAHPDEMTRRLAACTDGWRSIVGMNDQQAADLIRADGVDILVDLSLHTAGHRLLVFARKAAPVQVTYLGYCSTTGVTAIDYRLSDPYMDPSETDLGCNAEKTVRLPKTFWCYEPGGPTPGVSASPVLEKGFVTYGCLNKLAKISDPTLDIWAKVLGAVPRSRLLLVSAAGSHRRELESRLAVCGISNDRIAWVAPQPWATYIETYNQIDIALDPFPHGGGITTCDALWMGVPVVTLSGGTTVGRGGRSILCNIGLGDLVADSPDGYLRLAVDWEKWIPLRPTLRERMLSSPLMDAKQFARDVECAYREMWRGWCEIK